ncbi:glycosyltransferase family 4 protein [Patescibacteria group bacterium]|nr:glycosyltransferase family 4 protein [Patescibacteria group bacterium]
MRIGIDCRTILSSSGKGGDGVGHYIYQLVRHLLKIDSRNHYVLFFDHSVGRSRTAKFRQKNVSIKFIPFVQYGALMPEKYTHLLLNAVFSREKLDVFHSPMPWLPLSYPGKTVVTVHDLTFYKLFELYSSSRQKQNIISEKKMPQVLERASRIIAVSRSTSQDLQQFFNIDQKKIEIIYHGIDERFLQKNKPQKIKEVKSKYGITKKYLFSLSNFDPRKNIARVIYAYERLRKLMKKKGKKFSEYQLVLGGNKRSSDFKKIKKIANASRYKKDIIFPGYTKAPDLNALFEGASLFLFPSLYEGFGFPALEAMTKGVPVITSNTSSLKEIAGQAALTIDPYNVAEITRAIYDLLTDKKLYDNFKSKGRALVQKFEWEQCARKTLKCYRRINKSN